MVRQGASVVLVGTHIDCADPPDVALQVHPHWGLQGYLAHKKQHPPRILK